LIRCGPPLPSILFSKRCARAQSPTPRLTGGWFRTRCSPAFADYVDALGMLAIPDRHDKLVADVLAHEVAFWDMALS
jgi:hypothetical protein